VVVGFVDYLKRRRLETLRELHGDSLANRAQFRVSCHSVTPGQAKLAWPGLYHHNQPR